MPPANVILNCLGDEESETKSYRFNLIEALLIYGLVLVTFWGIIWGLAMDPTGPQIKAFEMVGYACLGCLIIWALIISPIIHRDTFHGLGLETPSAFIAYFKKRIQEKGALKGILPLILLFLMFLYAFLIFLEDIQEGLSLSQPVALILMVPMCLLATMIVSALAIRWDVFWTRECLKAILTGFVIVGSFLLTMAIIYCFQGVQEWSVFNYFLYFDRKGFLGAWFNYIWWGLIQHWIFLGYFNTRLRKGIPPKKYAGIDAKYWAGIINMFFFGGIHLPAFELAIFAFVGGIYFAYVFQQKKFRSLFTMGIIHGFGGALLTNIIPWAMSVGPWAM